MAFKINWEKSETQHQLPEGMITKMMAVAYPDKKIKSYQMISGGCANLNIKILWEANDAPLVLRIYLRDQESAFREQKIGDLLHQSIPVPRVYHIGEMNDYRFACAEFMPGRPLRDLLLFDAEYDIRGIMYAIGHLLSKIAQHEFPRAGFFNKNLQVTTSLNPKEYIHFAEKSLKNKTVTSVLSADTISKIRCCLQQYGHLFPGSAEKHLVHGDFDPANILVDQINGVWKVTGIVDWEFAFSGSILWDIANMLRYAHKMSPEFQKSFLNGVQHGGIILPKSWDVTIGVLNLLALLDCLKRTNSKMCPNRCADIRELIDHLLLRLDKEPE